jgi:anti-anti-sigma factor
MTVAQVHIEGSAGWPVAQLTGEVDLSNADDLGLLVEGSVSNAALGLVLDLTGVTYLDSTGLRLVFRLARELRDRQQQLCLVVPPDALIWRVLRLGGIPDVIHVVARLSDALPEAQDA